MKYFLCLAIIAEDMPSYKLIIKAENKDKAIKKMREYAEKDYDDYCGFREFDIYADELTQDYIIKNAF